MSHNKRAINFLILAAITVCPALVAACGSTSNTGETSTVDVHNSQLARCLERGGATIAKSSDELSFLEEAEASDEVSKFGLFFERKTEVGVDIWAKATQEGKPSEWLVWIAQPFGQETPPYEIVESSDSESYVAYIVKPTETQRKATERCTAQH